MKYNSILDLIGNTPLVKLNKIEKHFNLNIFLYAKLEKNNPAGSIKDRAVFYMLNKLLKDNKIQKGSTIIEPTSGNTGIALAALSNYFDLNCIIVMPSSMSKQRQELIKAYGAELVLVEGGMKEAILEAEKINNKIKDSIILGQFTNPNNPLAHYETTIKEILNDLENVDYIFAGIGTGGTISGIAKYIKENNLNIKIIGIEPEESPLLTKGYSSSHLIQGIGANIVPENYYHQYIDDVVSVKGEESIGFAKTILKQEGYLVGISSGACLLGAINYIKNNNLENKNIVLIFPDTGERYSWN